jgi:MFS family permease
VDDDRSKNDGAAGALSSKPASDEPPGLRSQIGATIGAGRRLFQAHVDLAKAEMSEIAGSVGRMVGLFAGAFALVLFAGLLIAIGGILFLGDWLFGSIGWGVLLGTILLIDLAVMAVLVALDVSSKRIGMAFTIGALVGIAVGLVLGLDLAHRGWQTLADAVAPQFDAAERTRNLAVGATALIWAVVGMVVGARAGEGVSIGKVLGGAVVGAVLGAIVGWLTSVTIPAQVGAAIGVLIALVVWPVMAALDLMRTGVDGEQIAKKFKPEATIELTKETIEWVRARTPLVPKS